MLLGFSLKEKLQGKIKTKLVLFSLIFRSVSPATRQTLRHRLCYWPEVLSCQKKKKLNK